MKIVIISFLVGYLYFFFTGKITWNGEITQDVGKRVLCSLIFALICSVIIGFPIWGIMALVESFFC